MAKKIIKITYTLLILVVLFIITFILFLYLSLPDFKPEVSVVEIKSEKLNESIYIKKKVWGLTADHQFICVSRSSSNNFEPDTNKDYIYYGDSFFYNFSNDTLKMYVDKESAVPKEFRSNINIKQIELTNPEMMDLWIYYDAKGLKKLK